jgi:hypothetical protein
MFPGTISACIAFGPQQRVATLLERVGPSGFEYAMSATFPGRIGGLRQTFGRQIIPDHESGRSITVHYANEDPDANFPRLS